MTISVVNDPSHLKHKENQNHVKTRKLSNTKMIKFCLKQEKEGSHYKENWNLRDESAFWDKHESDPQNHCIVDPWNSDEITKKKLLTGTQKM